MENGKEKKRKLWLLLAALLLLIMMGIGIGLILNQKRPPAPEEPAAYNPNAVVGALPGKTAQQIEEMLNAQMDETTVAFTLNSSPVFENGSAKGNLMLECPEVNINNIRILIRIDETGELIYDSEILKPNSYIYSDTLKTPLKAGSYDCTATIQLLDKDTDEVKGISQAALVITIQN
ncbi:hypothetical protein [Holdemania massiliensis]|uniref:hypothetical protein n=1 Tax=Holdemania massiliensis TaxID=1468449 RepID=UPI001F061583|nr:hypothetical protein [Holdemania massiliensis]MCH1942152.1 hypothetical protein [Holdemania massiliensis]